MKLTMASMDLKVDQARTKEVKPNKFPVRESITIGYKCDFGCYSILSLFF